MGKLNKANCQGEPAKLLVQEPEAGNIEASVPRKIQRITSKQLFSRAGEVEIDHNGTSYRLRQTSLGKLILTK